MTKLVNCYTGGENGIAGFVQNDNRGSSASQLADVRLEQTIVSKSFHAATQSRIYHSIFCSSNSVNINKTHW